MKTSHPASPGLNPLQDLLDLYNAGKVPMPEFIQKVIPLVARFRHEQILCHMLELITSEPARYHISSPHFHELWADAEAVFDASQKMKLALRPDLRKRVNAVQSHGSESV